MLKTLFLASDERTIVQVNRESHGCTCEMGLGESLVDCLACITALIDEAERLGEKVSQHTQMVNGDGCCSFKGAVEKDCSR